MREESIVAQHITPGIDHIAFFEGLKGKGCRIGSLKAITHAVEHNIEDAGYLVVVKHLSARQAFGGG